MLKLAIKNLTLRKLRTAISIFAVAVGIMTLVVLRGLAEGTIGEVANRMASVRADLLVWDKSHNTLIHHHTMSGKYGELIADFDGVARVVPVLNDSISLARQTQTIYAVPPEDFDIFGGDEAIVDGRLFEPRADELIVDTMLARQHEGGLVVGQKVEHRGQTFTICGIVREGVVGRVFMPYGTADRLWYGGKGRANMLMVKARNVSDVDAVTAAIRDIGLIVVDKGNYYSVIAGDVRGLNEFIVSVAVMTLLVSFLTVLLTMFTIVQEQTREVGILKSLGATGATIVRLIVTQSFIICTLGVAVGFALSFAARAAIGTFLPLMTVNLHPVLLATAVVVGLGGGLLGALYPAWRAARLDPVRTLSYE